MKLNYRDRVILGVLLAIVILIVGFVMLIKPKNQEIKDNKAALADLQKQRDETESLINEIPGIKQNIQDSYDEADKLTKDFVEYNDIYNARKVDQYMQHFAEETEVKILSLNAGDIGSGAISYYYFRPTFVAEDQLEQADINGTQQEINNELKKESESLAQRTSENILHSTYNITVEGEQENIWNYMKALEDQKETILIDSVGLTGIEIKEKEETNDEDEEEALPTAQFAISLYSLYRMEQPDLEMK